MADAGAPLTLLDTLMASARILGGRLATCDRGILEYSEGGHLSVLDARI